MAASSDASGAGISIAASTLADRATAVDSLGFGPSVDALAQFLTHPDTEPPLVVSVEGQWGSGKSSFLLQLQARLRETGRTRTVWFNPWRSRTDESVWAAFMLTLKRDLAASQDTPRDRAAAALRVLERRVRRHPVAASLPFATVGVGAWLIEFASNGGLDWIVEALTGLPDDQARTLGTVTGTAAAAASVTQGLRAFVPTMVRPLESKLARQESGREYKSRLAFIEQFHDDFEELVQAYAQGRRIVVFVDDLDRCEPARVADLMHAINLMLPDSAPIVFVMAMDREKVAGALGVRHKDIVPVLQTGRSRRPARTMRDVRPQAVLEHGFNFLEKFVQVPFTLPRPGPTDMQRFLRGLGAPPRTPAPRVPAWRRIVPLARSYGALRRVLAPPAPVEDAPPPPPPAREVAQTVERLKLRMALSNDSRHVHEAALLAAPVLEHNPRRLKQFLNLFRLRALIANESGILRDPDAPRAGGVTFTQLAKVVAVQVRWPQLALVEGREPGVLVGLERHAWREHGLEVALAAVDSDPARRHPVESDPRFARWREDAALTDLLVAGVGDGSDPWSAALHGADLKSLFETLPPAEAFVDEASPAGEVPPKQAPAAASVAPPASVPEALEVVERVRRERGESSIDLVTPLRWLAQAQADAGDLEAAIETLGEAVVIHDRASGPRETHVVMLTDLVGMLRRAGRAEEAKRHTDLLQLASLTGLPPDLHARVMWASGGVEEDLGNAQSAHAAYGSALERLGQAYGPRDPRVVPAMEAVARLAFRAGNLEGAEYAYAEALSIAEESGDPRVLARVLDAAARVQDARGNPDAAKEMRARARDARPAPPPA